MKPSESEGDEAMDPLESEGDEAMDPLESKGDVGLKPALPVRVDLHIDPLLWHEDLRDAPKRQADLPKLEAGGVRLAVFGLVSAGLPIVGGWRLFTRWQGWPKAARSSPWHAVMDQIERLEALTREAPDRIRIGRDRDEIEAILAEGAIAAVFGLEGAQALEGDASRLRLLRSRGVWSIGPVHLSTNALGGSSWPLGRRKGLSAFGRDVVRTAEMLNMPIDLAHLSKDAFWDVVKMTTGPIFCSHTGIAAVEKSWRNLDDDQLRAIADRGGVAGIMLATNFLGGKHLKRWVDHVRHAADIMGIEHVALGSDYDGFIPVPRDAPDASALPKLRQALLDAEFTADEADRILGENALAFLLKTYTTQPPSDRD